MNSHNIQTILFHNIITILDKIKPLVLLTNAMQEDEKFKNYSRLVASFLVKYVYIIVFDS